MTAAAVDPLELVVGARALLSDNRATTAGIWPRAAAVLARQGIELSLSHLWQVRAPGLQYTNARCQLLCLSTFLRDDELAERTSVAYWALSRALHHHAYELPPTHAELEACIAVASELGERVAAIRRDA
ncbi:MAG TPA: hypothetical protein VFO60_07840 [Candidatus Dormibacteraeota bacterium]|nr:hypothetical protein [Candidatus Dormibacteraeota bacterium]